MSAGTSERIHSMDALRASAMLLLIPVHAAGLLSANSHPGAWAVAIYWFVHVFRLPLFFAMSGFFLVFLLSRRGPLETVRNRTIRIAVPLAIGVLTLVPLFVLLSQATGTVITPDGEIASGSPFLFEPSFLWFLWYLVIMDTVGITVFMLAPQALRAAGARLRSAVRRPVVGIALLAVPTALALWSEPSWTAAPDATTFVPNVPVLAYDALFFALGATLCAHRDLIDQASRNALALAVCAAAAIVPAGILFTLHNSPTYGSVPAIHLAALLALAVATWTSLLALVGLASRYIRRPHPSIRYMADASYWIYLSHMPAMVLLVALLGGSALAVGPQFALIVAGSFGFSLLTYAAFVRYTPIGRLLNGPRTRPERHRLLTRRSAAGGAPSLQARSS